MAYPCLGEYKDSKTKKVTSVKAPPFTLSLNENPPYYGYCNNISNRNISQGKKAENCCFSLLAFPVEV